MLFRVSLLVGALLIGLAGCASVDVNLPPVPPPTVAGPGLPAYRLQPGDVLQSIFPAAPARNEQVVVGPDGRVSFPYAANLEAAGHTLPELTRMVVDTARIKDPGFTVALQSSVGTRVYVIGEVTTPGEIVVVGPITALQAVSRAGGFKLGAQTGEVVLMRRGRHDRPTLYAMDLAAAEDGTDPAADAELQPYDIVYVPRDRIANASLVFERVRNVIPFAFSFIYGSSVGF